VKLTDLQPEWIDWQGRHGIGMTIKCMTGHCTGRQWILFANPLDGGPAWEGQCVQLMFDMAKDKEAFGPVYDRPCGQVRWKRIGEAFESMSLQPSINAHECGHLTLTNGVFG